VPGQLHRQPSPAPRSADDGAMGFALAAPNSRAPAPPAAEGLDHLAGGQARTLQAAGWPSPGHSHVGHRGGWRLVSPSNDISGAARSPSPCSIYPRLFALTAERDSRSPPTIDDGDVVLMEPVNEPAGSRPQTIVARHGGGPGHHGSSIHRQGRWCAWKPPTPPCAAADRRPTQVAVQGKLWRSGARSRAAEAVMWTAKGAIAHW